MFDSSIIDFPLTPMSLREQKLYKHYGPHLYLMLLTSDVLDPNACSCRTSAHSLVPTLDPSDHSPFPLAMWTSELHTG